ncbi:hypothetical protein [Corynebacterium glyciniphilum]|nr:hypothetical protein [Corynebacterium glyciniphilum]
MSEIEIEKELAEIDKRREELTRAVEEAMKREIATFYGAVVNEVLAQNAGDTTTVTEVVEVAKQRYEDAKRQREEEEAEAERKRAAKAEKSRLTRQRNKEKKEQEKAAAEAERSGHDSGTQVPQQGNASGYGSGTQTHDSGYQNR